MLQTDVQGASRQVDDVANALMKVISAVICYVPPAIRIKNIVIVIRGGVVADHDNKFIIGNAGGTRAAAAAAVAAAASSPPLLPPLRGCPTLLPSLSKVVEYQLGHQSRPVSQICPAAARVLHT